MKSEVILPNRVIQVFSPLSILRKKDGGKKDGGNGWRKEGNIPSSGKEV